MPSEPHRLLALSALKTSVMNPYWFNYRVLGCWMAVCRWWMKDWCPAIERRQHRPRATWPPAFAVPKQYPRHGWFSGIKACSITSFGFGQKGAQALLVHPRYVLATIPVEAFEDYVRRRDMRWRLACRSFSEAMVNENMVSRCIKTQPPYAAVEEMAVLLDPDARFWVMIIIKRKKSLNSYNLDPVWSH